MTIIDLITLSQVLVFQNVVSVVLDPVHPQNLNHCVAKSTSRLLRNTLHKHHDFVIL